MQITLEQVITEASSWVPADRERLRVWLEEQAVLDQKRGSRHETPDAERQAKIQQWLADNRANYLGQWVALEGDRLIAHGTDRRKFVAEARASNLKGLFIHKFVTQELPFAGW